MRIAKLKELTVDELRREESLLQEQVFRLRFQIKTGNAENPSKLAETRHNLARVKTLLREHQLGIGISRGKAAAGRPKDEAASREEAK